MTEIYLVIASIPSSFLFRNLSKNPVNLSNFAGNWIIFISFVILDSMSASVLIAAADPELRRSGCARRRGENRSFEKPREKRSFNSFPFCVSNPTGTGLLINPLADRDGSAGALPPWGRHLWNPPTPLVREAFLPPFVGGLCFYPPVKGGRGGFSGGSLPRAAAPSSSGGTDHTGIRDSGEYGKCGEVRGIAARGWVGNGSPGGEGRTRPARCVEKALLRKGGRVIWFAR